MANCLKCLSATPEGVEFCDRCGLWPAASRFASTTVANPSECVEFHPAPTTADGFSAQPPESKPDPIRLPDRTPAPSSGALVSFVAEAGHLVRMDETLAPTGAPIVVCAPPSSASVRPGAGTAPATPPTPARAVHPKLIVIRGQKVNREYPVYEGRNTIGRFADKPVDIDLSAQEAEGQVWSSRHHAAITFDKEMLLLEDLNSLNGTWLNGARIHPGQQRQLKAGDTIQVGTVQLKLVVG